MEATKLNNEGDRELYMFLCCIAMEKPSCLVTTCQTVPFPEVTKDLIAEASGSELVLPSKEETVSGTGAPVEGNHLSLKHREIW